MAVAARFIFSKGRNWGCCCWGRDWQSTVTRGMQLWCRGSGIHTTPAFCLEWGDMPAGIKWEWRTEKPSSPFPSPFFSFLNAFAPYNLLHMYYMNKGGKWHIALCSFRFPKLSASLPQPSLFSPEAFNPLALKSLLNIWDISRIPGTLSMVQQHQLSRQRENAWPPSTCLH